MCLDEREGEREGERVCATDVTMRQCTDRPVYFMQSLRETFV